MYSKPDLHISQANIHRVLVLKIFYAFIYKFKKK